MIIVMQGRDTGEIGLRLMTSELPPKYPYLNCMTNFPISNNKNKTGSIFSTNNNIYISGSSRENIITVYFTEIQNYRLSTDAIPTHYSIKIHPHVEEEFFEGDVSIYVTAKNLLDKITLHSAELNITEAYINRIAVTFEHEDDEKLSLRYANDSIQPGEHVVHIKYRAELNGKGVGFMKATYNYKEETG